MAIEARVQYALDNFLKSEFFDSQKECYELLETEKQGKARIILHVGTTDNICVKNYDKTPDWGMLREESKFHMRKKIDHFILRKNLDVWELHMIEIKKSVDTDVWQDIKIQMGASHLKIGALLTLMGITIQNENVFIYTAFGKDKMIDSNSPSAGVTTKTFKTGEPLINPISDEWEAGFIYIPLIDTEGSVRSEKFKHIKIPLTPALDNVLEGDFTLPYKEFNRNI